MLEFLEDLSLHEKTPAPLLSMDEMEALEKEAPGDEDEDNKQQNTVQTPEDNSGLLPYTEDIDLSSAGDDNKQKQEGDKKASTAPVNTKKYAAIIKALHEKTGEFEDFNEEDFEDTPEAFLDALENWRDRSAQNRLTSHIQENLSPLQQKFIELVDEGVSMEDASSIVKSIKDISTIAPEKLTDTPEGEAVAKQLMTQYLLMTSSWSPERIKKEVDRKIEIGTVVEDAKEALPELVKIIEYKESHAKEQAKLEEQKRIEAEKKSMEQLKEFIETTDEIAGFKLNKKLRENWAKEYMPVATPDGNKVLPIVQNRSNNPQEFDALMRLYNAIGLFKYDNRSKKFNPDFSALKSLGKKDALEALERAVTAEKAKNVSTSGFDPETDTPEKQTMLERLKEVAQYEANKRKQ